ncbi:SMAD/FHA domain-containing protein isoform X2 [Wolffia australiana]
MVAAGGGGEVEAGFAKLQGEDFEYYMQTYSILLGRNSKKSTVDVDLASLGGGMNISRVHARIFYDFPRRRFALEVLGKNGCLVEGVLHLPGNAPVKLDSQDLLQIGDKKFYFLLPLRSILGGGVLSRHVGGVPRQMLMPAAAAPPSASAGMFVKKGRARLAVPDYKKSGYGDKNGIGEGIDSRDDDDDDEDDEIGAMMPAGVAKKHRRGSGDGKTDGFGNYSVSKSGPSGQYAHSFSPIHAVLCSFQQPPITETKGSSEDGDTILRPLPGVMSSFTTWWEEPNAPTNLK